MKKFILAMLILYAFTLGLIIKSINIDLSQANKIERNLHRVGGTFEITDGFNGYFLMRDYDKKSLPLLIHIRFDYTEKFGKKISDNISNFHLDVHGMNAKIVEMNFEDNEYYYSVTDVLEAQSGLKEIVELKNHEGEIAYLKKKFDDRIEIINNNDEVITYFVNEGVEDYQFSLDFIKDSANNVLNMTVSDYGEVMMIE